MITFLDPACRPEALSLASELRTSGLAVDVYPEASRKLEKPLKYASSRRVPVLAIIGPDEAARGEVAIRNLSSRDQASVARAGAAAAIAQQLTETGKDVE
jgi:histidyl-tRNA synthetase